MAVEKSYLNWPIKYNSKQHRHFPYRISGKTVLTLGTTLDKMAQNSYTSMCDLFLSEHTESKKSQSGVSR